MSHEFTITLASLPASPNAERTRHWAARYGEVKVCRDFSFMQALSIRRKRRLEPMQEPCELQLSVVRGKDGGRRTDLGNLTHQLKAVIDGIADAGWLKNDGPEYLTRLTVVQHRDDAIRGVEVRVSVQETA